MMTHATLWLAQIQFFAGVGFMLLFLVLELGLAWVLLVLRACSLGSARQVWLPAYRFWARVFALAAALGFAASIPLMLQFGSLWPGLLARMGDVAAPLLAGLILSSFVFKAGFLGAMLFGERRLPAWLHLLTVGAVALGVSLSSFFMLALMCWVLAPAGAFLRDGQYVLTHLEQTLFNPALASHGLLFVGVAVLSVAFLMLAVSAGQSSRNPADAGPRLVFRLALCMALVGVVIQVPALQGVGRFAAQHQPAKAAATAAYWNTGAQADLLVLGWPDSQAARNRLGWTLHGAGEGLLAADGKGNWRGLDQFSGMHPPVALTFWSYRLMWLITLLMALTGLAILVLFSRGRHDLAALPPPWGALLRIMSLSGWPLVLASLAYVQFGAFPYAIYGSVTLSEVVTPQAGGALLLTSLAFLVCYGVLIAGFSGLLRHVAQFGVVPVSRRRWRA